jgi:hypothetical protein
MSDEIMDLPDNLVIQLLELIDRLREETAGFAEQHADQQQWYDRGYANGMVLALQRLGQQAALATRCADDPALLQAQVSMPWGRAYRHGEEVGSRETHEITGTQPK